MLRSSRENSTHDLPDANGKITIQDLYRKYAPYSAVKTLNDRAAQELLEKLLTQRQSTIAMIQNLEKGVRSYATKQLTQIGNGDNYTNESYNINSRDEVISTKASTKLDRVKCVNILLEMIQNSDINEIYQYVKTPAFLKMAGKYEKKFNIFRTHLIECIDEFSQAYENHLSISNNENLIAVLTHDQIRPSLDEKALLKLLIAYNPLLIADIIVNHYGRETFGHDNDNINIHTLRSLLNGDPAAARKLNLGRATARLPLIFAERTITAGKNTVYEESLTPAELYQYEDSTIYAVENWIMREYSHMMLNKIQGEDWPESILSNGAKYYFYMLSAAKYMLIDTGESEGKAIDPKNPPRYLQQYHAFRDDLHSLIESIARQEIGIPVILCGMVNVDGVHYIPYFIHAIPNQRAVSILTVDPSPHLYRSDHERASGNDGKAKSLQKLKNAFQHIFYNYNVIFEDADIPQMLRERDCGPNSATTLCDAFKSVITDEPLLSIDKDGCLQLDPNQLSIKGKPVGINPYNGMLMYPVELDEASLANRAEWAKRLQSMTHAFPCTIPRRNINDESPLCLQDIYFTEDQMKLEFSYNDLVAQQQSQDTRETNLSALRSLLMSSDEGRATLASITASFKQNLAMPSEAPLAKFITANITHEQLLALTSEHNGNLSEFCKELIITILKDHIPNEITNHFSTCILDNLPDKLDLNAELIISTYIEQYRSVFSRMNMYQQRNLLTHLEHMTYTAVQNKLKSLHMNLFASHYNNDLSSLLGIIKPAENDNITTQVVQIYSERSERLRQTIDYLSQHDRDGLERIINDGFEHANHQLIINIRSLIQTWFEERFKSIGEIIDYYHQASKEERAWSLESLANKLPAEHRATLTDLDPTSIAALRVLQSTQDNLAQIAASSRRTACYTSIQLFLDKPEVQKGFFHSNDPEALLRMRVQFASNPDSLIKTIRVLIEEHGCPSSITTAYLNNPDVGLYLIELVHTLIKTRLETELNHYFQQISDEILGRSKIVIYDQFNKNTEAYKIKGGLLQSVTAEMESLGNHYIIMDMYPVALNESKHVSYFNEYFDTTVTARLMASFNILTSLITKARAVGDAIYIVDKYRDKKGFGNVSLFDDIILLVLEMESTNLFSFTENELNNFESQLEKLLKQATIELFNNPAYKKGEVKPGSYTAVVRSILCQLLGIPTKSICTINMANGLDERFHDICKSGSQTTDSVLQNPSLINLAETNSMQDAYGKPLNRAIILSCISYWYTQHNKKYNFTHTETWFDVTPEPEIIRLLIAIINNNDFENDDNVTNMMALRIRTVILKDRPHDDDVLRLYESDDITHQVKANLLKSSSLSKSTNTQIAFKDLARLLNLPLSIAAQPKTEPDEEDIAHEVNTQISNFINTYKQQHNDQEPPADRIEAQKRGFQMIARQTLSGRLRLAAALPELNSVKNNELRRATGGLSFFTQNGQMSKAEKVLMKIRLKHTPHDDFFLDESDINLLRRLLKNRWLELKSEHDEDAIAAQHVYLLPKNRSDKVYIAIAELIAKQDRSNGLTQCYMNLLAPDCPHLANLPFVNNWNVHESIIRSMGLIEEYEDINDTDYANKVFDEILPISDVVFTRSGQVLSMPYILYNYGTSRTLINPYTNLDYTKTEMEDIAKHHQSNELLEILSGNLLGKLTPPLVSLIRNLVNNSVYKNGFSNYYSDGQNKQAEAAFAHFYDELSKFSRHDRDKLMSETIPNEGRTTVQTLLKDSAEYCLTLRISKFAKIVIAYEGENHGLNDFIYHRMNDRAIKKRNYNNSHGKSTDTESGLYEIIKNVTRDAAHQYNRRR